MAAFCLYVNFARPEGVPFLNVMLYIRFAGDGALRSNGTY